MKVKMAYKPVDRALEEREIEDDYKEIQKLCGGFFSGYSVAQFFEDGAARQILHNVVLYCNDTGKLDGLAPNCYIGSELLVGNIAFFAFDEHGEHVDMTAEQYAALRRVLKSSEPLRYKPDVIEAALRHCVTKEQCDGCSLADVKNAYCGQILNVEVLKYIEILKDLNRTFAQRLEELEATTAKADSK